MHKNKYAHRDIKPSNIVFNKAFLELNIIDFGCCIKYENSKEKLFIAGTPYYMPSYVVKNMD